MGTPFAQYGVWGTSPGFGAQVLQAVQPRWDKPPPPAPAGDSDAMQDDADSFANAPGDAHAVLRWTLPATASMDEEGHQSGPFKAPFPSRSGSALASGGRTPVTSGLEQVAMASSGMVHVDSHGFLSPSAAFSAASLPSHAAHRRPGEAGAATVQKWEQLLRDHPNDPMVCICV